MNWSCEDVIRWAEETLKFDEILISRLRGKLILFIDRLDFLPELHKAITFGIRVHPLHSLLIELLCLLLQTRMSSFACSLCSSRRDFASFKTLFRHIGLFHQNDPSFRYSCDVNASCGFSYTTYAAYKAHVYRHHVDLLQASVTVPVDLNMRYLDEVLEPLADEVSARVSDEECDPDESPVVVSPLEFDSDPINSDQIDIDITLEGIQRLYVRFLIQLREEFLLPKNIILSISSNIVALLARLHELVQQQSISLSSVNSSTTVDQPEQRVIESEVLTTVVSDISRTIEATTRSEYEFINLCKRFLHYREPQEVLLSTGGHRAEYGYFVPISRTLSSFFRHRNNLSVIVENVARQRQATKDDDDLMLSLRDGNFGAHIDDESLLLQLYVDDIGLTNPLGSRRDAHKMTMIYFLLEDIPDQFRSQVRNINLVAIGPSRSLKVQKTFSFYNRKRYFSMEKCN